MADIKKISVGGTVYDIKDETARPHILDLTSLVTITGAAQSYDISTSVITGEELMGLADAGRVLRLRLLYAGTVGNKVMSVPLNDVYYGMDKGQAGQQLMMCGAFLDQFYNRYSILKLIVTYTGSAYALSLVYDPDSGCAGIDAVLDEINGEVI